MLLMIGGSSVFAMRSETYNCQSKSRKPCRCRCVCLFVQVCHIFISRWRLKGRRELTFWIQKVCIVDTLPPPPLPLHLVSLPLHLVSPSLGDRTSSINRAEGRRQATILASEAVQTEHINTAKGSIITPPTPPSSL